MYGSDYKVALSLSGFVADTFWSNLDFKKWQDLKVSAGTQVFEVSAL